jgi:hypothetical protein
MNTEISEPTYRAIAHCRKQFAEIRGVSRNAIDQLMAGNTHDLYPPFREWFRDVCATEDSEPDHYINDLLSIKQKLRPPKVRSVGAAAMEKIKESHEFIEKYTNAIEDGLDKHECNDLITLVSKLECAAANLKASLINEKNILAGAV